MVLIYCCFLDVKEVCGLENLSFCWQLYELLTFSVVPHLFLHLGHVINRSHLYILFLFYKKSFLGWKGPWSQWSQLWHGRKQGWKIIIHFILCSCSIACWCSWYIATLCNVFVLKATQICNINFLLYDIFGGEAYYCAKSIARFQFANIRFKSGQQPQVDEKKDIKE